MSNIIPAKSYFHLSFKATLSNLLIVPRIPYSIPELNEDLAFINNHLENITIPRFCMSPNIEKCLNSISHLFSLLESYPYLSFHIYTNSKPINHYITAKELHEQRLVFDAYLTDEIWVQENITLEKVGNFDLYKHHLKEKLPVKLFNEENIHQKFYHYIYHNLSTYDQVLHSKQ